MSFLAIQSVDNGGAVVLDRSAAQISSYISIVTSLGTVIFALLLARQNRSQGAVLDDTVRRLWFISFYGIVLTICATGEIPRSDDTSNSWPGGSSYFVCIALCIAHVVVSFS